MHAVQDYRVSIDVFSGPLDLLLYLVRRNELDVQDIRISEITDQYLHYVRLIEQLDPNAAGEFLVMASTLIEMKSRAILPSPPLEPLEEPDDPRSVLVRQLLEYKRFKDASRSLADAAETRARRYTRRPADLPESLRGVELEEVEVWDLLAAYAKVMTAIGRGPLHHEVIYDQRPIEWFADRIIETLERRGTCTFESLLGDADSRGAVVGTLLALLELMRTRRVRAEQARLFGTIYLYLLDACPDEAMTENELAAHAGASESAAPAQNGRAATMCADPAAPTQRSEAADSASQEELPDGKA